MEILLLLSILILPFMLLYFVRKMLMHGTKRMLRSAGWVDEGDCPVSGKESEIFPFLHYVMKKRVVHSRGGKRFYLVDVKTPGPATLLYSVVESPIRSASNWEVVPADFFMYPIEAGIWSAFGDDGKFQMRGRSIGENEMHRICGVLTTPDGLFSVSAVAGNIYISRRGKASSSKEVDRMLEVCEQLSG